MTTSVSLRRILEQLDHFSDVVRSQLDHAEPDLEGLMEVYLETRRAHARDFRQLADAVLITGGSSLQKVIQQIAERMQQLYKGILADEYLIVHGYSGAHPVIFEYLLQNLGRPVAGSRLRILTADQVHTERRVRELRDLGLSVEWKRVSDEDQYVLLHDKPDLESAVRIQLQHNIKSDRSLSASERNRLLNLV